MKMFEPRLWSEPGHSAGIDHRDAGDKPHHEEQRQNNAEIAVGEDQPFAEGPSPSGRDAKRKRDSAQPQEGREAPGEGRRSCQTLTPSPCPLPRGEGDLSAYAV